MRKTVAAGVAALTGVALLSASTNASANASPRAACNAVIAPTKTVQASALAQYLQPSSTKIQPTSFSISTRSQGIDRYRTDFTLHVQIYSVGLGVTHKYDTRRGTHTVNDVWGPTFSTLKTLPKGKNRVNIDGWFDYKSNAYAVRCGTGVSFAF
ncbi:hypothetical protein [Streptomyces sp. NPDC056144]|uniref:hypothetical protein n=1 Tax=unclassified Streptomyces TaxID=2593676 RepID=UPI0035DA02A7